MTKYKRQCTIRDTRLRHVSRVHVRSNDYMYLLHVCVSARASFFCSIVSWFLHFLKFFIIFLCPRSRDSVETWEADIRNETRFFPLSRTVTSFFSVFSTTRLNKPHGYPLFSRLLRRYSAVARTRFFLLVLAQRKKALWPLASHIYNPNKRATHQKFRCQRRAGEHTFTKMKIILGIRIINLRI